VGNKVNEIKETRRAACKVYEKMRKAVCSL
jgi:hypothetical protein